MFRHILIPTDGSLLSSAVVESGIALAQQTGARITVLTVLEPMKPWWGESRNLEAQPSEAGLLVEPQAIDHLAEAERKARQAGVTCITLQVEHEQPYRAIVETARQAGCDLIAMASHGRRGIAALVIGSETTKVLTHSSIPVLVYR
jgi:nucleotide-binding universal stress UspA family protein